MKQLKYYTKIGTKGFLLTLMLSSSLTAMDVATYYDVDIKTFQISIEGSKKVLKLMQSGAPLQELHRVDEETQKRLVELFASVNSTPSKHAGFYMKHQKEVWAYYENNATLQEKYQELKEELEATNQQIKMIREANK